uniref:Tetraspanin n=1 Tax=Timema shepardi TaxID=629360 RepID=A0A7R9B5J8_TIMSH|nr:unnamed protein product [Timema shepardi]
MGCGITCVKYLMFIFNFVFALAGIALLTIGALVQAKVSEAVNFLEGKVSVAPILLIVVGSIVFIISFYGCCGAIRESSCMVTTFSIFLMVILTLEIVIAVLAFVYRDVLTDDLQTSLKESVDNYHNNSTAKAEMDSLQISVSTRRGCLDAIAGYKSYVKFAADWNHIWALSRQFDSKRIQKSSQLTSDGQHLGIYSSPAASLVLTDSSQLTSDSQHLGIYSSPMASLVLTDSSQLTSDSQHLGADHGARIILWLVENLVGCPCGSPALPLNRQHLGPPDSIVVWTLSSTWDLLTLLLCGPCLAPGTS